MSDAKKSVRSTTGKASTVLTDEEKAAMKETLQERKRARSGKQAGEDELLAKIAEMPAPDRAIAERLHSVIKTNAPSLAPTTWYGMPAYSRDGKPVCFFQAAQKFKSRYATFGFSDSARLDDGEIWPVAYALTEWTEEVEKKIAALVSRAAS